MALSTRGKKVITASRVERQVFRCLVNRLGPFVGNWIEENGNGLFALNFADLQNESHVKDALVLQELEELFENVVMRFEYVRYVDKMFMLLIVDGFEELDKEFDLEAVWSNIAVYRVDK